MGAEIVSRLPELTNLDNLQTTFVSHYTKEVSLAEALQLDAIWVYGKRATGAKYLINPNKAAFG